MRKTRHGVNNQPVILLSIGINSSKRISNKIPGSPEQSYPLTNGGGTIRYLVIVEHSRYLETALRRCNPGDPRNRFVSLDSTVSYQLDRRMIPYTTPCDYGGSHERYCDSIQAYGTVSRILEEIDTNLSKGPSEGKINTAIYSFFTIKTLFDAVQTNIHLLKEIIAKEKPDTIITFGSIQSQDRGIIPFSDDEPVFAKLLALEGWNVPVINYPVETPGLPCSPPGRIQENRFRQYIAKNSLLFNMAMIARRNGLSSLIRAAFSLFSFRRIPVVIYGSGYNWDDSLEELYYAGFHPIIRYQNNMDSGLQAEVNNDLENMITDICNGSTLMNRAAVMYGIDARPLLFNQISLILSKSYRECLIAYKQFSEFFRAQQPKCLLLSTQASHVDRAVIRSAHNYGIPVISWQHGGAGYAFHPMMPFGEYIDSDVHLVFGNAVKESYCETSRKLEIRSPKFTPVGSSSLDNLAIRKKERSPARETVTILYVTTLHLNNTVYVSDRLDQCTFDERLTGIQKKIIDLAKKNPPWEFVVKLHPSEKRESIIEDYATVLGTENVTFVRGERTISQLANHAELSIFDINSTGLLQIIPLEKPIFLFSGLENHDPHTMSLLKKRAFVCDTDCDLIRNVEKFFISGFPDFHERSGVCYADTEFIREYGTFKNDGRSAVRAAHVVKGILDSHVSISDSDF